MKRISYFNLACAMTFALGMTTGFATLAVAGGPPLPTSATTETRVFNDCPASTVNVVDAYPALISIDDTAAPACTTGANLHIWRFSTDNTNPQQYNNGDVFRFAADLVIEGPGQGESGLQISPWFSPRVDGRFNVRTTDGEIAVFGGVLPFYNFSGAPNNVRYVKGTPIHLEMNYNPRSNTIADPGQIEYKLVYNAQFYTSGILLMEGCNTTEEPIYGCYGILNFAQAGGHLQALWGPGAGQLIKSTWTNIQFHPDVKPTAAVSSSWGRVKTLYR
ncbi:MAG TPA: hypothetical protein VEY91_00170 [Candidatus Limnocylindria bacterium]|nr:hypothetical protein [Candidatus Limnocylindria bacterium]